MAAYQYVYVMKNLTKAFPGGREVFKGITLSFLPGVKIGVLGVNGAGKSTLLKIMAGIETEYGGEAWAAEGAAVGYLSQEPQLDAGETVGENVEAAFADLKAAIDRFNEISMEFAEPMDEAKMNDLLGEQADLQAKIDAEDGWDLDRRVEIALDALRCPPAEAKVATLSGGERRRVALCRLLLEKPDLLLLDEPTNHLDAESVAWLEQTLRDYTGTVMMVTHDRYFLDNVTSWILEIERGRGYPFEGNYSVLAGAEAQAPGAGGEGGNRPPARARRRAGMDRRLPARPPGEEPGPHPALRGDAGRLAGARSSGVAEIVIPPGPRLGNVVIEAEGLRKGYGNTLLIDGLDFKLPPGGIVGVIGPNGAGKTTLFRMIIGQEQPDAGTLRIGDTVEARLRRSVARQPRRRQDGVAGDQRRRGHDLPRQARGGRRAPMSARSTSRARTSRRRSASCRAASATGCTWRRC